MFVYNALRIIVIILKFLIPYKPVRRKLANGAVDMAYLRDWSRKRSSSPQNFKKIPIFIISYNRLSGLKLLIPRLEEMGYTNIQIVDNNSTYPPLLDYLHNLPHPVHYMEKNYGHFVFWKHPKFYDTIQNSYYTVTDPDVLPIEDCPDNFIEFFYPLLHSNSGINKVGFSLKIDDLPDHYTLKPEVIEWEKQFYKKKIKEDTKVKAYYAHIDTTFALYGPQKFMPLNSTFFPGIRTGYPYQARHLPWYKDLEQTTDEDLFYLSTADSKISTWSGVNTKETLPEYILQNKKS